MHSPSLESFPLQTIPRLLGRNAEAIEACRNLRPKFIMFGLWRNGWFQQLLDYNCALIGPDDLLRAAGSNKWSQSEAHYYIGMSHLAEANRNAAREHFGHCVATRIFYSFEYQWSRAFLARMEQDPTWPPWIPVKPEP